MVGGPSLVSLGEGWSLSILGGDSPQHLEFQCVPRAERLLECTFVWHGRSCVTRKLQYTESAGNGAGKSTLLSIMGGKKMVPRNAAS